MTWSAVSNGFTALLPSQLTSSSGPRAFEWEFGHDPCPNAPQYRGYARRLRALGAGRRVGSDLRRLYYRLRGASIGDRVRIEVGVTIDNPSFVHIGDDCWIDRYAILIAGTARAGRETRMSTASQPVPPGEIRIGQRCHVGPYVVMSGLGGLLVKADVTLSAGCKVYSLTHHYRSWGAARRRHGGVRLYGIGRAPEHTAGPHRDRAQRRARCGCAGPSRNGY